MNLCGPSSDPYPHNRPTIVKYVHTSDTELVTNLVSRRFSCMHCQVESNNLILWILWIFFLFFYLCMTVISKRFELECHGWSQIEVYSLPIMDLMCFSIFHTCNVKKNATTCYYSIFTILPFWPQTPFAQFFRQNPNFSKSKHRRSLGPTFLDSSHHFWSIIHFFEWKKNCFIFFLNKNVIFTTFLTTTMIYSNVSWARGFEKYEK